MPNLLYAESGKNSKVSLRFSAKRFDFCSSTSALRPFTAHSSFSKLLTNTPSNLGTPRFIGTGSSIVFQTVRGGLNPLSSAHSAKTRPLISTWSVFCFKNSSAQSYKPVPGRATGKTTSGEPSVDGTTSTSSHADACSIVHVNVRGFKHAGPKFARTVAPLKVTVGNSAWPSRCVGSAMGLPTRCPSLKRLTVFTFGVPASKLTTMPSTLLRRKPGPTLIFSVPRQNWPSMSNATESFELPRSTVLPPVDKPTRMTTGATAGPPQLFAFCTNSITFTSNMYRPAFMPTVARAPANR
mmetsp:Transcript_2241/g.5700  ORF Transcript_2241/g.5700 Transcript_2241/m.5700 type:complete len:296 (-) Transcript_2241:260-1147(-)